MSNLHIDQDIGDIGGRARRTLDTFQYFKAKEELLKKAQNTASFITQLAAFVPDFILLNKSIQEFNEKLTGVAFLADVSGFTALTEAYSLKGKGGTEQLTKTLSSYIGPLAECILLAGGDIYKYAGDAFLAVWRIDDPSSKYSMIQKAVDCALYIQEKYGVYETELGIKIRVKIGIGVGEICQLSLNSENNDYHHFVCFGRGVKSANEAEGKCVPGDVILDPNTWRYCDPSHFNFTLKEDGFAKITEIITFQRADQRGRPGKEIRSRTEEDIRPTIPYAVRNLEGSLRTFVIPPVIKKIEEETPLEYLNESRQTSVCFIKIDCSEKLTESSRYSDLMTELLRQCFKQVYNSTLITNGCLTKVIMFDKGLTYLVVFGLPGYIHDNQSANAIKFSFKVKSILHEIHEQITEVSIGVTSGTVYCGILGHKQRQEYTVIGRTVNKAARLMCYYPNRVTCDQDTLYHSKLPVNQFSLMEAKELKGIKNVGNIYEYVGSEIDEEQGIKHYEYPIVNRETENKLFQDLLEATENECTRFLKLHRVTGSRVEYSINKDVQALGYWVLVLEGDIGVGKSRLLSSFIEKAEKKGALVFSITMSLISGSQSLFAIRSLLYQALNLDEIRSYNEREDHLRKLAGSDEELLSGLCLLNDVMNVKFPIHSRYVDVDIGTRRLYSQHIASVLVRMAHPKSLIIFFVDDAHYMDAYSWDFLVYLSRTPTTFSVLTIRRDSSGLPKLSDPVNQYIYHHKHVKSIRLTGLDLDLCLTLACQFSEVNAIPLDLEKILKGKSKGNPAWIEQVLKEWLRTGLLRAMPFDLSEAARRRLEMAIVEKKEYIKMNKDKKALKPTKFYHTDAHITTKINAQRLRQEVINAADRMIVVKSNTNIASVKTVPGSLREILLDAFDELDSNQQMIIKCASVLGTKFSRRMITKILPFYDKNKEKYESSLKNLMFSQVIQCASPPTNDVRFSNNASQILCYCKFTPSEILENTRKDDRANGIFNTLEKDVQLKQKEKPHFHHCKFLKFTKDNMPEVVYELMTEDQRKEFHLAAAKYLELSPGKCSIHGGDETTYEFGFIIKGNDIAADIEEALVAINSQETRHRKFTEENKVSDRVIEGAKTRRTGLGAGNNKLTAFNKIREIYHNNGSKIGEMELDIFKELEKFELSQHSSSLPARICCCSSTNIDREREYDFTVVEGKGRTNEQDGLGDNASCLEESSESGVDTDLRGCYCVQVHTKVSVELVRHYQIAEKFGKCLLYLLDAAESATSIGEITQSFIHLEDAKSLLHKITNNEIVLPSKEDPLDWKINPNDVQVQLDFLYGLSYFESGIQSKAIEYFKKTAHNFKITIPDDKVTRNAATARISALLWKRHHISWMKLSKFNKRKSLESSRVTKLRLLAYLHELYQSLFKLELALYISLYQAKVAEESGTFDDILPAYCSVMESFCLTNDHKKSKEYEKLALKLIRDSFLSQENQDPVNLHSTSKVFISVSSIRLIRGEINSSIDAGYIALRIANLLHNNVTASIVYPRLVCGLMFSLRISEVVEALQKFWYITEEDEDWGSIAKYYVLCLTLFLNTAYPMEPFSTCEQFVKNSNWDADIQTYGILEVQYDMEAGIALWHLRFGRWGTGIIWFHKAEEHRPTHTSYLRVGADLKLLECMFILVFHFLQAEHYQRYANYRDKGIIYMKYLEKDVKSFPVFSPRLYHLLGYYCQIRSRKSECNAYLKKAERIALEHGNNLEIEWVCHNRAVWADNAVPTIKNFWLEHTERNTLDWHQSGKIPWANIMYSLPLPAWK